VQDRLLAGEFRSDHLRRQQHQDRHRSSQKLIEAPPYVLVCVGASSRRSGICHAGRSARRTDGAAGHADDQRLLPQHVFAGTDVTNQIVAQANTHEMVRSLVGKNIGFSILNMRPETAATYSGDQVVARPLKARTQPWNWPLATPAANKGGLHKPSSTPSSAFSINRSQNG
jgi:hypothetical protein